MGARAAAFTVLLAAAAMPALARIHPHHQFIFEGDSGRRVVGNIRITDRGVRITTSRGDTIVTGGHEFNDGPIVIKSGGAGLVKMFADAHVGKGEHIQGDVVAVFGSVDVAGEISGDAVAVFGAVRLEPGALVDGDAVAVGGALEQAPGARVNGQSVSLGFLPLTLGLPALPVLLLAIAIGWLVSLFVGWLFALLFPERLMRIAATASRRTTASLLIGVLAFFMFPIVCVLLLITVIGIPIAILLPLAYAVALYAGQLAVTYGLGCKLVRRPQGEGGAVWPLTVGTLFVAAFFGVGALLWMVPGTSRTLALFFILLGVLLVIALSMLGSGALLVAIFDRSHKTAPPAAAGPPPAAAPPVAPAPAIATTLPGTPPPIG